jgi:hypothetical protein
MTTTTMVHDAGQGEAVLARDTGLTGRVLVTWTVAGGLLVGGFLVAGMTLAGRLSGNALLMTAGALYVVGALLGFAHGAVLGFLGRPADVTTRDALGKIGMAALYAVPAATVGFLVAGWIAMTMIALYLGRALPLIGAAVGWAIGLALLAAAAVYGVRALRNAYARWPDWQLGTALVAGTFAALLLVLLADRPELWGTRLRVTETGAVLLAALGTIWIAGPVITMGLWVRRLLPVAPALGFEWTGRAYTNVAMGLAAGVVLGVLAVPFQQAAFATGLPADGRVGGVVLLVSRALVDEVLLRLFLVTGMVWLLVRNATPGPRAAVIAVAAAAIVQVLLYMPGVNAIGFPTFSATAAFVVMTVLLPAMVFGMLFWKRGLATAVIAHATALLALALMI